MDKLLTIDELAELLAVRRSWIYQRTRKDGVEVIPHFKIGKYLRFRLSDVEEFLSRKRYGGARARGVG